MTQSHVESKINSKDEVKNERVSQFLSQHLEDTLPQDKRDAYKKLSDYFDGIPAGVPLHTKIAGAFRDFKNDAKFSAFNLDGFPKDDKAIDELSQFIASKLIEIHKAVFLANQLTNEKDKNDLLLECTKYFKTLHDHLVDNKILPSVIPETSPDKKQEETEVLFWSSELGQGAANAYAQHSLAMTDTTAGTKFINQLYGYDLLKEFYEKAENEAQKSFYWQSVSYIYAAQLKNTSKSPVVFLMDTITEDNYFTKVELPILRQFNIPILLRRIVKNVESSHIVVPQEQGLSPDKQILSNEINQYDRSAWSFDVEKKEEKDVTTVFTKTHTDLLDKTKNIAGSLDIHEEHRIDHATKIQTRHYKIVVALGADKNNQKIHTFEFDDPSMMANILNIKWQGQILEDVPLDLFFDMRALVKSDAPNQRRATVDVPHFERGISSELSSSRGPSLSVSSAANPPKSPKLGIAFELRINHTWLYAYLEYNARTGDQHPPVFGPLHYFEDTLMKTPDDQKEKTAIEFMKIITKQVQAIQKIIDSDFPANDPAARLKRLECYEAFSQIILDSIKTIDHLKSLAQLSPQAKKAPVLWQFLVLDHQLGEYLTQAKTEVEKLMPQQPSVKKAIAPTIVITPADAKQPIVSTVPTLPKPK